MESFDSSLDKIFQQTATNDAEQRRLQDESAAAVKREAEAVQEAQAAAKRIAREFSYGPAKEVIGKIAVRCGTTAFGESVGNEFYHWCHTKHGKMIVAGGGSSHVGSELFCYVRRSKNEVLIDTKRRKPVLPSEYNNTEAKDWLEGSIQEILPTALTE